MTWIDGAGGREREREREFAHEIPKSTPRQMELRGFRAAIQVQKKRCAGANVWVFSSK